MSLTIIVYFGRIFATFLALPMFLLSNLLDRRVYFHLLFATLHASVSTYWGATKRKKTTFRDVATMALNYLTIKQSISAQLTEMS